jgi:ribosomal protein S18 acetylase RimI-like enzyme
LKKFTFAGTAYLPTKSIFVILDYRGVVSFKENIVESLKGLGNIMIEYITDKDQEINWEEAVDVMEKAPLGKRDPEKLERAFASSYAVVYVFENDKLIGFGRAISDGEYHSAIYDIVLLPEYQGKGIGSILMDTLLKQLKTKNIILFSVPGKENFYRKIGFRKMLTGMAMFSESLGSPEEGYLDYS